MAELIVILALQVPVQVQMMPSHSVCLTFYKMSQDSASISINLLCEWTQWGRSEAPVASVIKNTKAPFTHVAAHSNVPALSMCK